jgi:hypothetical protein
MGNLQSGNVLEGLYASYKGTLSKDITGAGEGMDGSSAIVFGNAEKYEFSLMSASKKKLIKQIATILHKEFKTVKDPKNMSTDEIVAMIRNSTPARSGYGFKANNSAHVKACNKIADAVNSVVGTTVIDTSESPDSICDKTTEVLNTLTTNLATEFGPMRSDMTRVSKNLDVLEDMVKRNFNVIKNKLGESVAEGAELNPSVKPLIEFHDKLLSEVDRQRLMLKSLTDTLSEKTSAELEELLKGNTEFKKLVGDIKSGPGSDGFSKKLAYVMNGISDVATMANTVDKALRQIGMSKAEYKSAMKPSDVKDIVNKKLTAKLGTANEKELQEYLKAAKKIISVGYFNKEVASKLGGVEGGLKLDKRVKKREETRRGLLDVFNQQLSSLYNTMSESIKAIAKAVNSRQLPLNDSLQLFMNAVEILPDIGKKRMYFSLTGYHNDNVAKEEREKYLSSARNLIASIEELTKHAEFGKITEFRDLQRSLTAINELIETFNKRFSEGFGPMEAVVRGSADLADPLYGGKFNLRDLNRTSYEFARSLDTLKYGFRVGKMRENMKKLPKERDSFTSNYTKIVGDAIADAIDTETEKKNILDDLLADGKVVHKCLIKVNEASPLIGVAKAKSEAMKQLREVRFAYDAMYKARVDMYRTSEAIEHYMNAFTNGIAANPDDVSDIMHMLNSVEIISTWYGKNAGNEFCHVFDCFPSISGATLLRQKDLHKFSATNTNDHYYKILNAGNLTPEGCPLAIARGWATNNAANKMPGIPFLSTPVWKDSQDISLRTVLEHIDNALQVNPLKNIINIFLNIGAKFGSQELITKSHMNGVQIYKALLNYIKYSALSVGLTDKTDDASARRSAHALMSGIPLDLAQGLPAKPTDLTTFNPDAPATTVADCENAIAQVGYFTMAGVGKAQRDNPFQNYNRDAFFETDKLFQMTVKSIVSKVFTTIGVYNMMNKPIRKDAVGFYNHTRMVIGGSGKFPQVIDEALELYVRLPLLAEFYRELFNFKNVPAGANPVEVISMVPEMSGTFSGFVSLIFDKAKYVTEGNYSETDTIAIIEEINKIWLRFKGSKNPVNDVIDEFIMEVNRRYGVLEDTERDRYLYEYNNRFRDRYTKVSKDDIEDFAILPDEDDDSPPLPAPSQAFQQKFAGKSKNLGGHKHKLDLDNKAKMLRLLRKKVEDVFKKAQPMVKNVAGRNPDENTLDAVYTPPISFANILKVRANELKHAGGETERFRAVQNAINGFGSFATSALDKSYVMFHEVVIAPLVVLGAAVNNVSDFKAVIEDLKKYYEGSPKSSNDKYNLVCEILHILSAYANNMDNLVELQIDVAELSDKSCDIRVNISHAGFISTVKSQLTQVKSNIDKFRGVLPTTVLDQYIDYDSTSPTRKSSIANIEREIDRVIHGRDVRSLPASDASYPLNPIDLINETINSLLNATKDNVGAVTKSNIECVIDRIVGGDAPKNKPIPDGDKSENHEGIAKILFNTSGKTKASTPDGALWGNMKNIAQYPKIISNSSDQLLSDATKLPLWQMFNRLVALYLTNIYDESLRRVYATTIEKFASGSFSSAVFGSDSCIDNFNPKTGGIGLPSGVLYKSIALIIKQIVSEPTVSGDKKQYLESDLAEIPNYMKERLKCSLPIFAKLFTLMERQCETVRKFAKAYGDQTEKKDLNSVLDRLVSGCQNMLTCINDTIGELNDSPKYMELNENFIDLFKASNKKYPFMPYSSLTLIIGKYDNLRTYTKSMLPCAMSGSAEFKLMYGARGLLNLNNNFKLSDMPGMMEIMKWHNAASSGKSQFNDKDIESTLIENLKLLRFCTTYVDNLVFFGRNKAPIQSPIISKDATLQLSPGFGSISTVSLTESPTVKDKVLSVSRFVRSIDNCKDYDALTRESIRVYNIIDMNKMPINIAALMKEMPMVNLHNYSYSFDAYMMQLCGVSDADVDALALANKPFSIDIKKLRGLTMSPQIDPATGAVMAPTARGYIAPMNNTFDRESARLLGLLLMFPHDEITPEVYDLYVTRLMNGDTAIQGLDRPAFLSDELYNKALLNGLYRFNHNVDESGPRVESRRGHPISEPALRGIRANIPADNLGPGKYKSILELGYRDNIMTYIKDGKVENVDIGADEAANWRDVGKMRFDTKLIRNYVWIANLQRVMRLQMRNDLYWYDSKIVSDHAVLAPNVTEMTGNASTFDKNRRFMN